MGLPGGVTAALAGLRPARRDEEALPAGRRPGGEGGLGMEERRASVCWEEEEVHRCESCFSPALCRLVPL